MAQDILDAVTKSPASRQSAEPARTSTTGPKAPAAPSVPSAQGASMPQAPALAPLATSPGHLRPQAAVPGRPQVISMEHGGLPRRALIVSPGPGAKDRKTPAIVFLHGAGGSPEQAMRQTGLAQMAARAGFLAVFPEGLGRQDPGGSTWNAWMCCGFARDQEIDDVGFLAALIGRLTSGHGADPRRIYVAGFSNGAMLASRLAMERPGLLAAIAVVAGSLPCGLAAPAKALPVLLVHGARDHVARFAPTPAHPATGDACEDYPARAQADYWVRGMKLSPKPVVRELQAGRLRVEDYPARPGGRGFVRYVIVKEGGHAWPGGARERYRYCDLPTGDLDASALVLDFFRRDGRVSPPAEGKPTNSKTKKKTRH
jgi:polyhydroxybutyrate depolymerase